LKQCRPKALDGYANVKLYTPFVHIPKSAIVTEGAKHETPFSPGETVVTAKATRQYRPLLQAMNDGVEIPGLASGGSIGMQSAQPLSGASASGPPTALVRILPSPLFKTVVEEQTHGIVVEAVEDYDRNVAPETVKRTINSPRSIG
jgi:hypothetical protein